VIVTHEFPQSQHDALVRHRHERSWSLHMMIIPSLGFRPLRLAPCSRLMQLGSTPESLSSEPRSRNHQSRNGRHSCQSEARPTPDADGAQALGIRIRVNL